MEPGFFSDICVKECVGACCDPWWGIISYGVVKHGGLESMAAFKVELTNGIKTRERRIVEGYCTTETPSRPLFNRPEKYNVKILDLRVEGTSIMMTLLAMYAFRCEFLSKDDSSCLIHPAHTDNRDIRPPHCGFMGSLNVRPGEKGYCRIIHAAENGNGERDAVRLAIEDERRASLLHYNGGVDTPEEAASRVIEDMKERYARVAPQPRNSLRTTLSRNDPCFCGSGKKFKKCHGM